MFGDTQHPELRGESASLRCYNRSHMCGGQNLANIDPPNYPTDGAYSHPLNDCQARMDDCPAGTDTSGPTSCSPLHGIQLMANEIKGIKSDPDNQILVAGIFGWPRSDPNNPQVFKDNMAAATYKIAPIPNPNSADTQHPTVFDSWPVCYDPNHMPANATTDKGTGFDATAAGWGATAGLRNSAFVDQFGVNGLKFSICEPDFTNAMSVIGDAIAKKLQNLCVDYKLLDSDVNTPGLQPDFLPRGSVRPSRIPMIPTKTIIHRGPRLPCRNMRLVRTTPRPTRRRTASMLAPAGLSPLTPKSAHQWSADLVWRTAADIAKNGKTLTPGTKIGIRDGRATRCAAFPAPAECRRYEPA